MNTTTTTYKSQQCDTCGKSEFLDSKMVDNTNKFGKYSCGVCKAQTTLDRIGKRMRADDDEYRPVKSTRCGSKSSPTKKLMPIPETAGGTQTTFGKINQLNRYITQLKSSIDVLKASLDTLHANFALVKINSLNESQRLNAKNSALENRVSLLEKFILQYMQLAYPSAVGFDVGNIGPDDVLNEAPQVPTGHSADDNGTHMDQVDMPAAVSIKHESESVVIENMDTVLMTEYNATDFYPHDLWYHDNTCNYGLSAPLADDMPAFEIDLTAFAVNVDEGTTGTTCTLSAAADATMDTPIKFDPREILEVAADFLTESESKEIVGTGRSGRFARRTIKKELIKGII